MHEVDAIISHHGDRDGVGRSNGPIGPLRFRLRVRGVPKSEQMRDVAFYSRLFRALALPIAAFASKYFVLVPRLADRGNVSRY